MSGSGQTIAILGCGNIGTAIAEGLGRSGRHSADSITLTRRKVHLLSDFERRGFHTTADNRAAVSAARIVVVAVDPQHADALLMEIRDGLDPQRHLLISVVSGMTCETIRERIGKSLSVVRAMPNTAIAIRESMTCVAAGPGEEKALELTCSIFDELGRTLVIDEEQMVPATALCACGIAFFLRAVRAASQGGIEIGFHAAEALMMAAQTAKGAASLLLVDASHPEEKIDKVTTPRGCTISGLNRMEHEGFSSAMIQGIVTSAEKAAKLYVGD